MRSQKKKAPRLQLQRGIVTSLVAAFALVFCTQTIMAEMVAFADANLETAVRNELGIPNGPIYDTDMETMTETLNLYSLLAMRHRR